MFCFLNYRSSPVSLLLLISIFGLSRSHHFEPRYRFHICSAPSNITTNSNLGSDLIGILGSLSEASSDSFYNRTFNGMYGLVLCRGDISNDYCHSCVSTASRDVRDRCPLRVNATIWYDECMLRYSDKNFLGTVEISPRFLMGDSGNQTSPDDSNIDGSALLSQMASEASVLPMMYKANKLHGTGYGLVQCTRDLNSSACCKCLMALLEEIGQVYKGRVGWRILSPSCSITYEKYLFYSLSASPQGDSNLIIFLFRLLNSSTSYNFILNQAGLSAKVIAVIIISTVAAVAFLASLLYCLLLSKKRRQREQVLLQNLGDAKSAELMKQDLHSRDGDNDEEMHYFSFITLQAATNNFADANRLGEGGFGPVFKGKLMNGEEIAVKRLSVKSSQGHDEFKNEVMVIMKLQHKNLVKLLGCCLEGEEKLLVYEYMANTSLDALLFDPVKCKQLDWLKRNNIINGVAKGILYLHEDSRLKIVHRDLKASNVLLDDEMNAKISDFGTARIFGGKQVEASTNRVVGTFGYMAPEYAMEGVFSVKSDVYSFGILMLEVISGRKNSGFFKVDNAQSLLSQAWQLWKEGREEEMVDPNLVGDCSLSEALRWIQIGLLCVQEDPNIRPTMSMVVLMLGSKSIPLPQPSKPPFFPIGFPASAGQSSTTLLGTGYLSTQSSTTASI
ncbi:cysteine-rich receptor-like protein kinase 10 isoform X2 [Cucurbita pepo subsp. pepo]|uniref:cysteine-rich receptor-like protein kinase 10 isoform X2 n=1 Tax=Cucurbita pepo subsp. pepo TaxID=3664 RepID=UPI000C9D58EE|nr:cysteine-rich receptor-like protein kinase 10 isoform X2 [Cucurbita pepo subsp. pepo]